MGAQARLSGGAAALGRGDERSSPEFAFLGVVGLLTICVDQDSAAESWGRMTWVIAGALSTLAFLGHSIIGSSVIPVALALVVAALLARARRGRGKVEQAAHFVLGAIMQGFVTFVGTLVQNLQSL